MSRRWVYFLFISKKIWTMSSSLSLKKQANRAVNYSVILSSKTVILTLVTEKKTTDWRILLIIYLYLTWIPYFLFQVYAILQTFFLLVLTLLVLLLIITALLVFYFYDFKKKRDFARFSSSTHRIILRPCRWEILSIRSLNNLGSATCTVIIDFW